MSDDYRLIFSGEVLEGQHPAVVRKKLAAILKLGDDRMDILFSGKPVVVKKSTDKQNAARYQQAFEKAGARLRVLPADEQANAATSDPVTGADPDSESPKSPEQPPASGPPADGAKSQDGLSVLPVGADLLAASERAEDPVSDVDTSHLKVQGAVFDTQAAEAGDSVDAPNVDHLSLAALGEQLGADISESTVLIAEIEVEFDLAEVGTILGNLDASDPVAPIDVDAVNFDLAEPGAELNTGPRDTPPAPPDTSHLQVDD